MESREDKRQLARMRAHLQEKQEIAQERDEHRERADAYREWILRDAESITDCSCRYMRQTDGDQQRCPTHELLARFGDLPADQDPRGEDVPRRLRGPQ